jgi:hypothetical protein
MSLVQKTYSCEALAPGPPEARGAPWSMVPRERGSPGLQTHGGPALARRPSGSTRRPSRPGRDADTRRDTREREHNTKAASAGGYRPAAPSRKLGNVSSEPSRARRSLACRGACSSGGISRKVVEGLGGLLERGMGVNIQRITRAPHGAHVVWPDLGPRRPGRPAEGEGCPAVLLHALLQARGGDGAGRYRELELCLCGEQGRDSLALSLQLPDGPGV